MARPAKTIKALRAEVRLRAEADKARRLKQNPQLSPRRGGFMSCLTVPAKMLMRRLQSTGTRL